MISRMSQYPCEIVVRDSYLHFSEGETEVQRERDLAKVAQLGHQVGRMGFESSLSDLIASLNLRSSQPSTTSLPPPHTLTYINFETKLSI